MYKILMFALVLVFDLLSAAEIAHSRELTFIKPPGGFDFNFSKGLPQPQSVWFVEADFSADEWRAKTISENANSFVKEVTKHSIAINSDAHVIFMKMAFIVQRPIAFLTSARYLSPRFQVESSPGMHMDLVSHSPLVFNTQRKVMGLLELNSTVEFHYFDEREISARPNLQKFMSLPKIMEGPPKYIIFRYAERFNRILQVAMSSSEFYPLDAHSSVVVSYALVTVDKSWLSGFSGMFARDNLREEIQQIVREGIYGIESFD